MRQGSVNSMPFDESNIGDPFAGDFPDRTGTAAAAELAAAVERQASDLALLHSRPEPLHQLLRLLQRRRQGTGSAGPITPLGLLPGAQATHHLHVPGELLVTGLSYDGRTVQGERRGGGYYAQPHLDLLGMQENEVECAALRGRVVRLTHPDMGPHELADLARALRVLGFTASLTNITPTAPVTKGIGGPDPIESPGDFHPSSGSGQPARVAIIDTGIAGQRRTDGWLQGIQGELDPLDAFPPPHGDHYLDADAGHGTFVSGIVQQVAPGAQIRVYRAVDSDGIASEVAVACAMIRAVVEDGAQIINLSLGCHTHDNVPPIAIAAALDIIAEWEHEHHTKVVVVAAAGNYGNTVPCWPAAFREVVSVAALTRRMYPATWSSRGFWVRCSTIGQGVQSTYVEGRESPDLDPSPYNFGPNSWAAWSGTSFAAAQVTGALARLHASHGYAPDEALRRLLRAGRPTPDFGRAVKVLSGA
jgi:Subtilase family